MPEVILLYVFIFVIGLIFGSFLNVIIDRMPFGRSILFPASHCPHCKHKLSLTDLIPVFSFFALKGKCRYCRTRISSYYPIVEVFTAALFVMSAYFVIGNSTSVFLQQFATISYIVYLLVVISSLIIVFFVDLKYGIIPFKIVIFALAAITLRYLPGISYDSQLFLNYFLTALGVFAVFLLLFLLTKGKAIGFGDVFFSLLMGYILGFPRIILAVYIAFLTGALISLILVLANKKKLKGGTIPFGPFLVSATIFSLFWGDAIINYLLVYFHV